MSKKRQFWRRPKGYSPTPRPNIDPNLPFAEQLRQYQEHIDKVVKPKHEKFLRRQKPVALPNLNVPRTLVKISRYERYAVTRAWCREPLGTKRKKQLTILLLAIGREYTVAELAVLFHVTVAEVAGAVNLLPELAED